MLPTMDLPKLQLNLRLVHIQYRKKTRNISILNMSGNI